MRLGPSIRALRQLLRLNSDARPGGKPSIGSAPESLPPEGVFRPRLRVGDDEGHLAPARTPSRSGSLHLPQEKTPARGRPLACLHALHGIGPRAPEYGRTWSL